MLKALFFFFRFAFSLENIYKELSTDIDGFVHPGHGDLSGWAKQGEPSTARCVLGGFQHTLRSGWLMFIKEHEKLQHSQKTAAFIEIKKHVSPFLTSSQFCFHVLIIIQKRKICFSLLFKVYL